MEGSKEFLKILLVIKILYIVPIGIICLVILAIQRAHSYTPESWERGINIMVGIHISILYVLFRVRERMRLQTIEDTRRQQEIEDLFRMETEFMEQLRSQGIELENPTLDSNCA
ncbi:uncharacterized protein LOC122615253 isoform X2 [Drosophila teissieri]|uniref:uncharacterized protein LOC122615253 isoform X2 n=1 Tax=Drosophila teissieri TaxID=7243 RepID=UPI001CBA1826|nr:uncharacterized protein LOC122615253 isoform X2 [Drosophila teissieri]